MRPEQGLAADHDDVASISGSGGGAGVVVTTCVVVGAGRHVAHLDRLVASVEAQ